MVVGGGSVAWRKARSLWEAEAEVTVISPQMQRDFLRWSEEHAVEVFNRPYRRGDLEGSFLVVAATDRAEINRAVAEEGERRAILVNVVDDKEKCNFIAPATVKRGPLQMAVSTSGASPMMAKKIRRQLEERYPPTYGNLVAYLGQIRQRVLCEVDDPRARREIFDRLTGPDVLKWTAEGRFEKARGWMEETLNRFLQQREDEKAR